jgi:hypothetical protein
VARRLTLTPPLYQGDLQGRHLVMLESYGQKTLARDVFRGRVAPLQVFFTYHVKVAERQRLFGDFGEVGGEFRRLGAGWSCPCLCRKR